MNQKAFERMINGGIYHFGMENIPNEIFNYYDPAWANEPGRTKDPATMFPKRNSKNPNNIHASIAVAAMMLASRDACVRYRPGSGVIKVNDSCVAAEYSHKDDSRTLVLYNFVTGSLNISVQEGGVDSKIFKPFPQIPLSSNDSNKVNTVPIYMALIAGMYFADNPDSMIRHDLDQMLCYPPRNTADTSQLNQQKLIALRRISDEVYFSLKNDLIPFSLPAEGFAPMINNAFLSSNTIVGTAVFGCPEFLSGQGAASGQSIVFRTIKDVLQLESVQNYRRRIEWTEEEKQWIPSFPEETPVPKEVVKFVKIIAESVEHKKPICQIEWRGTSGYGKSTGVEMFACILNKPLLRLTCHSKTEVREFLTEFVPNTYKSKAAVTFEEIALDPEGAYARMTGKRVEGITCEDAFQEAMKGNNPYIITESPYIRALEHGYIIEVQEASRMLDSGQLTGLNEFDRPGAMIPKADGTYARRHHDAVVFFTDNKGYDTCHPLESAVNRRISVIKDSKDMPKENVIARVMSNTKDIAVGSIIHDKDFVSKMYDIWEKVKVYAENNDLIAVGGSVTIEELERWMQLTAIYGLEDIQEACIETVVSKATSDDDEQMEILSTIVVPEISSLMLST